MSRSSSRSLGGDVAFAAAAAGAAAAVGAFAWGALVERSRFTVRRETVPILPPGSRSLTVLHLSDLHMAPWQTDKQEWIRSLAVYEPDLVVDTGDNLGHVDAYDAVEYALEPFRDVAGVFVHGSNDYVGPQFKSPFRYFGGPSAPLTKPVELDNARLTSFFESLGWLDLDNTARAIEIKGNRLEFFGVNDAHRGWARLERLPGALDELRENVGWQDEEGPESVSIGLTHAPYQRVLDSFTTNGADLVFAGHTHGGQVCVPGYGALVTNCDIPRKQVSGLSMWNHARKSTYLEVSAGLGTSIYAPVRFACRPEAVVVTLTASDMG
ncbi:3',5'-cyclic adenosine monophosphate phosphodiesterase CpdA [Frondihabitans sp. 762G35]|uniref:metallophosphoesterase n=1 Tax=Frondihabitans sp. 762G35 TaxID=1446794 RepID=UPI000D209094|nr:metallophosphoesterase [Frondihabitans sp. 762G35]ARC57523.1 3',5'-cyclic adenosine monophosphate phosphodiesterase CpdA [Frondihabitans sp. 762G35]